MWCGPDGTKGVWWYGQALGNAPKDEVRCMGAVERQLRSGWTERMRGLPHTIEGKLCQNYQRIQERKRPAVCLFGRVSARCGLFLSGDQGGVVGRNRVKMETRGTEKASGKDQNPSSATPKTLRAWIGQYKLSMALVGHVRIWSGSWESQGAVKTQAKDGCVMCV
ncbi:hypothetical protein Rs2_37420 [Raphanus sativus]|nr:hypothetical protein Rs2_37420 [Raphanus sativus]